METARMTNHFKKLLSQGLGGRLLSRQSHPSRMECLLEALKAAQRTE